jgi:hypothetical protein
MLRVRSSQRRVVGRIAEAGGKPVPGVMLHQDGSRHLWLPALGRQIDLIVTMDECDQQAYSVFLVEEEGTWSSLRGIRDVISRHGPYCELYN